MKYFHLLYQSSLFCYNKNTSVRYEELFMNLNSWLFFTDMDDTLLNKKKEVTPENAEAISRALACGHKIIVNSGRPLASLIPMLEPLGLTQKGCYCIGFNGGQIYDSYEKKVIYRSGIRTEDVKEIFRKADAFGLHVQTYSDTHLLVREYNEEAAYYEATTKIKVQVVPDLLDTDFDPPGKVLVIDLKTREKMDRYRESIQDWIPGRCSVFYSNPIYLEHVPEHVSKGDAIRRLCEYLDIPLEHTVGIGDEENDLPMIQDAGVGVAMANAIQSVKDVADYITTADCEHSGVAEAIYRFLPGCAPDKQ